MSLPAEFDRYLTLDHEINALDVANTHLTDHTKPGDLQPRAHDALKDAVAQKIDPMTDHASIFGKGQEDALKRHPVN